MENVMLDFNRWRLWILGGQEDPETRTTWKEFNWRQLSKFRDDNGRRDGVWFERLCAIVLDATPHVFMAFVAATAFVQVCPPGGGSPPCTMLSCVKKGGAHDLDLFAQKQETSAWLLLLLTFWLLCLLGLVVRAHLLAHSHYKTWYRIAYIFLIAVFVLFVVFASYSNVRAHRALMNHDDDES